MVICLERGADLLMAQRFHCHSRSLASVKSRLDFPFWYQFTKVVPDKGPLNGCVCVCVCGKAFWISTSCLFPTEVVTVDNGKSAIYYLEITLSVNHYTTP